MKDLSNENVIHIIKGDVQYLQFKKLLEYDEIIHAYPLGVDLNFRSDRINKEKLSKEQEEKDIESFHIDSGAVMSNGPVGTANLRR